jgi:cell division protein FtsB
MAMRWLSLVLVLLLGLVQAGLWLGDGGLTHVMKLQRRLSDKQHQIAEQKALNARLVAEIDDLKRGLEMVEERARSELGMVKADEIFVQYAAASGTAALGAVAAARSVDASGAPGTPGPSGRSGRSGRSGAPGHRP